MTPGTQKAETGGLKVQGHLSQLRETLSQNKKDTENLETWGMAQRTKSLPCKFEALSSGCLAPPKSPGVSVTPVLGVQRRVSKPKGLTGQQV